MPGRDGTGGIRRLADLDQTLGQADGGLSFDVLTGLPSRMLFRTILERAFASAEREGVALLRISADIAALREDYGSATTDALIAAVAGRLRRSIREGDVAAKLRDAEFGLLLAAEDVAEAACAAQRVLDRLREPYEVSGSIVDMIVSIGIAYAPPEAGSADTLLTRAEIALERARSTGLGEWKIFKPGNATDPETQKAMLADLQTALDQHQLSLGFQPIAEIGTLRLRHAGAVLRWDHPKIGLLDSTDFLPVLNDREASRLLAHWAIRGVCDLAARTGHGIPMIVALDGSIEPDERLHSVIVDALAQSAIDPGMLMIGVPEPSFRALEPTSLAVVNQLRDRGVRFVLDDLSHLSTDLNAIRRLPIDAIRTSPAVVEELRNDIHAFIRVQALTGLAHSLGLATIARGVDREEDVALLAGFGFGAIEGAVLVGALTGAELRAHAKAGLPIAARKPGML